MTGVSASRREILTDALRKIDDLTARLDVAERSETEPIAVVGIGCRLPGAVDNADDFWELLDTGRDAVVRVPPERWDADAYYSPDHTVPGTICSREGGFLSSWRPDEFDAEFFGISPREAAAMDPQHRLLLEVACEAMEHAGITADGIRGSRTATFIGLTAYDYILSFVGQLDPVDIDPHIPFGNAPNFAAGRLSYFLGIHGPAMVVDTACSSSLVAVHLACQSLRRRESDQALAGGANLILTPANSIACSRWGMLAPDGRCKTFDVAADGYVRSEGAGVVVLKRLADALRDDDHVLALVRGSAVNQDGPSSGQTVPSGPAQQAVLRQALASARLRPCDIDYIEAHGTGTALGDPIELDALSHVFGDRGRAEPLILGSAKTNLGHLESAAGIVGFIKTVLSLHHGRIPRHLHFSRLTPHAGPHAARFTIPAVPMPWPAVSRARRAGVSSFGVSGTNAHVVLEEAPARGRVEFQRPVPVSTLVVSGKTAARLARTAAMLADWMQGDGADVALPDIAHTLNHHRTQHKLVASVSARDHARALTALRALAGDDTAPGLVRPHEGVCRPGRVFVYSGQGAHWAGMGRRLLADEPAFASAVEDLEPMFFERAGFSLRRVLERGEAVTGDARVQPVIVGLQLALTALWRFHGVEPDAVIGHSVGEVTAAIVAEALTPAQGLDVVTIRSRLMAQLAGRGAVALVELDVDAAEALISGFPGVSVAGHLSPRQTVIAGPVGEVDAAIAAAVEGGRFARRVNMEVASHTAFMDPILGDLRAQLGSLRPQPPVIPMFSTVHPTCTTPSLDARYWADNVRLTSRFSDAVRAAADTYGTFIEISAHPILTHAVTETLGPLHHHSLGTLWRDADDTVMFHTNVSAAQPKRHRGPHPPGPPPVLPSTPWHRTSHWIAAQQRHDRAPAAPGRLAPISADGSDTSTLTHAIVWRAWSPDPLSESTTTPRTVAVIGRGDEARQLEAGLENQGYETADVDEARCVVYLADATDETETHFDCAVRLSTEVAGVVQRLAQRDEHQLATLWILTRGVHEAGSDTVVPQSCLWGLGGVVGAEHPGLWGGVVDVPTTEAVDRWVRPLAAVLGTPARDILALHGGEILCRASTPLDNDPVHKPLACRPDGAYLITGGMGALGLLAARWLADRGARRLILAGREALPPRHEWDSIAQDSDMSRKIDEIRALENHGVTVHPVSLDIGSRDALSEMVSARNAAGAPPIRGVIHAAGVTDGQLLTDLVDARLRRTLWPKVAGAQVLHEMFPPGSLDFLFLVGAAGAVFGVPGQGAYAAANAYLDGLAQVRHRQGCHTVSLDWVAWQGLGFATDARVVLDELQRWGSRPISPGEAFLAWDRVHTSGVAQALIAPMEQRDEPHDSRHRSTQAWDGMSIEGMETTLATAITRILAREIQCPEQQLEPDVPFAELGLNSVMATSIRREIEDLVGLELSVTMLWNHPTITALARHLAGLLSPVSESDDVLDMLSDEAPSLLDDLFDSVESASAGSEGRL